MKGTSYRVVRFTPDPVRDEPLNIGLVITGPQEPVIHFPDEALRRAARWCRSLDAAGLVALREVLEESLRRQLARSEDIGESVRADLLGERFGPVSFTEPRWIEAATAGEVERLASYLVDRLVLPPKPVPQGFNPSAGRKLAAALLKEIRKVVPTARTDEPLVGFSGREFTADIFGETARPFVVDTLVVGSNWQGSKTIDAKAFEMFDISRSMPKARLGACCVFPDIDPEGVQDQARMTFASIDVAVIAPSEAARFALGA
jgi:hypothetical protein